MFQKNNPVAVSKSGQCIYEKVVWKLYLFKDSYVVNSQD